MTLLVSYDKSGSIFAIFDSEINVNIPESALELSSNEADNLMLEPDAWMVDTDKLKLIRKPAEENADGTPIPTELLPAPKLDYAGLAAAVRNTEVFGKAFALAMQNVAVNGALTFFMAALNPAVFVKADLYSALSVLHQLMTGVWNEDDIDLINTALADNGFTDFSLK